MLINKSTESGRFTLIHSIQRTSVSSVNTALLSYGKNLIMPPPPGLELVWEKHFSAAKVWDKVWGD